MPAHWTGQLGGAEIQVRYLLAHLRRTTSHEIAVICRHSGAAESDGVPIYRINLVPFVSRYSYLPDYLPVTRLLARLDPDVIYTRVGTPLVGYCARYCAQHGKRHVHHIARMDDVLPASRIAHRNAIRRVERQIYEYGLRKANIVIAQAEYQAQLLSRHFGRDQVVVIPNFHPEAAHRSNRDGSERVVLWIANLKPAKRPEAFLDLAKRCKAIPKARFIMIGALSDKTYAPLIREAQNLGNFSYAGALPIEEVNDLLNSAHLLVNTSTALGEGFPNTFIQAWLRGVPVVSLEVNPDSLLTDGRLGICSENSTETLVGAVEALLQDADRLERMGQFAIRHARDKYGAANLERVRNLLENGLYPATSPERH